MTSISRRAAAVVTAGALMAAGCIDTDGQSSDSEPAPTAVDDSEPDPELEPEPEPRPANVRYDSVYDLRDRAEEAGVTCEDWVIIGNPDGAIERATCTSAVVLSIHENAAEVQRSVDFTADLALAFDLKSHHVVGPNWSVNCGSEADICVALRESLGGEVDSREP
jgi:hypothetical protein